MTRLALVGFRSDANSSYMRGAASAPPLIREALRCESSNSWSESGIEVGPDRFFDAGDVGEEPGREGDTPARIEAAIGHLLDQGLAPISLGGDHSITYPILRAFAKRHPRLTILHFDAHPDIYDEFEGTACRTRVPSRGSWRNGSRSGSCRSASAAPPPTSARRCSASASR